MIWGQLSTSLYCLERKLYVPGLFMGYLIPTDLKCCSWTPGSMRSFAGVAERSQLFSKSSFFPGVAVLWVKFAGILGQIEAVV